MKTIIIPAYNEAETIKEIVEGCKKVCSGGDEIIIVDDSSEDKTLQIANKLGVRVLEHKTNMGKAVALKTGIKATKNNVIVTIDADCTYPPEEIPKLVKNLREADLVVGSRFKNGIPGGIPINRGIANVLGALYASIITFKRITDVTSGLRAFRKDVVMKCEIKARGLDFEAEFTIRAITLGYRYKEVPINFKKRVGKSKLNFFRDIVKFFNAMNRGRFL